MKAIMVMFDTLNRHMLSPYGGPDWIRTPEFQRLAERSVVFGNSYIGSMPCMPARRELHTGRYNFLHRSWGPLEPFDDSAIEKLGQAGVYTHLVTDHQHYWEDGGGTYHPRYRSFELVRGQEGDPWKGEVEDEGGHDPNSLTRPDIPAPMLDIVNRMRRQDRVNRKYIRAEDDFPQARTFAKGLEFIRHNAGADRWFLQLETFDPHEPFYSPEDYRKLYPGIHESIGRDWPAYGPVTETEEEVEQLRLRYAALLSMCDRYLGKVLDVMDELDLWKDTLLIVNTDHGFLLGEHGQWAKCVQPFYNEVAHTPLFIWDPRSGKQGEWRDSLVQTIDLPATLLDFFGVEKPADMQGSALRETIADDRPVRRAALFGIHGGHVCVTDGRYVYMRAAASPANEPLYEYTLMPTHMRNRFHTAELKSAELAGPFTFTKEVQVLKIPSRGNGHLHHYGHLLYDLERDPLQREHISDEAVEKEMIELLLRLMKENDAPAEQFRRLGLESEWKELR
ncbi:sulfatase [Paenibacillus stellifer]|uniref:Sulfatase n=1 Tax=Paenibacillus stellifer TaxID=169760 RepID=A0A089LYR7_9BACL|nr:sulfatase-like hydrolase/transferase [Paenibacillus stellifer]AIQ65275.1 sulfatase [Paenibacillus stellifer]